MTESGTMDPYLKTKLSTLAELDSVKNTLLTWAIDRNIFIIPIADFKQTNTCRSLEPARVQFFLQDAVSNLDLDIN